MTNLPGGDVGMLPMALAIELLIAIPISLLLIYLIRRKYQINEITSLWVYILVVFTILIFAGLNPFNKSESQEYRNLEIAIIVISITLSLFLTFLIRVLNRLAAHNRKHKK